MKLLEAEAKLSELNNQIADILKERESVLKEWNIAFHTENQDQITCIDGGITTVNHDLYLVNGDVKMLVCRICNDDMKGTMEDLYKRIDISMHLISEASGRGFEIPEYQRNFVSAKVLEIKESLQAIEE